MRKYTLFIMGVFVLVIYSLPGVVQAYTLNVTGYEAGQLVRFSPRGGGWAGEFTVTIQDEDGQFFTL